MNIDKLRAIVDAIQQAITDKEDVSRCSFDFQMALTPTVVRAMLDVVEAAGIYHDGGTIGERAVLRDALAALDAAQALKP